MPRMRPVRRHGLVQASQWGDMKSRSGEGAEQVRVLVVDDEKPLAELVVSYLEAHKLSATAPP